MSLLPGAVDRGRVPHLNQEGGDQDQGWSAFALALRSART
jgi:hypothetical protein